VAQRRAHREDEFIFVADVLRGMSVDRAHVALLVDSRRDDPAGTALLTASGARRTSVNAAAENLPARRKTEHALQPRKANVLLVQEKSDDPYPVQIPIGVETTSASPRRDDDSFLLIDSQCLLVNVEEFRGDADRVDGSDVGRDRLTHLVIDKHSHAHGASFA
jgi:hypothetical protein